MRKKWYLTALIVVTLLCVALPAYALSVKLNKKYTNLGLTEGVNDTGLLIANVYPAAKSDEVTWKSGNENVVTVSQQGALQAVSIGKTRVTATVGKAMASCTVKVSKKPVTAVTLNKSTATVYLGRSPLRLLHKLTPQFPDNPAVVWYSTDPTIASVSQSGVVTPLARGKTTVYCKTTDGSGKKAKCVVTVKPVVSVNVTLSAQKMTLMERETARLSYGIVPADATDKSVRWTSSNPRVVSVDGQGGLSALKKGTATITCRTVSGGKTAKCTVTVKTIEPKSLILSETALRLGVNEAHPLSWTVLPANAINKTVKWSSSNTKVVTVDENGILTGIKSGKATVTGKTVSGCRQVKCAVTVYAVDPESISLTETMVRLPITSTRQLQCIVYPDTAVDKTVTWTSSDTRVVSVDENGLLTPHTVGTATVTCKTVKGGKSAACSVSVGYYGTTFRAMVIGQKSYTNVATLYSCPYDAQIMDNLFKTSTVTGQPFAKVDKRTNLTSAGILAALDAMQGWGADEDDVTVFYYSGHGTRYNGESCILGTDYSSSANNCITVSTVKKKLDALKGTVIIVFDSCYSGGMADLMSKGLLRASNSAPDPEGFNSGVVNVFAPRLFAKSGGSATPTYYVLTACTAKEESYTDNGEYKQGSFFTRFLGEGAGYSVLNGALYSMAADSNGDGMCSLHELYAYAKPRVQEKLNTYPEAVSAHLTQTVTIYPANCAFPLMGRN